MYDGGVTWDPPHACSEPFTRIIRACEVCPSTSKHVKVGRTFAYLGRLRDPRENWGHFFSKKLLDNLCKVFLGAALARNKKMSRKHFRHKDWSHDLVSAVWCVTAHLTELSTQVVLGGCFMSTSRNWMECQHVVDSWEGLRLVPEKYCICSFFAVLHIAWPARACRNFVCMLWGLLSFILSAMVEEMLVSLQVFRLNPRTDAQG